MKPAEEDALVESTEKQTFHSMPMKAMCGSTEYAIRLAIRAAVAHERERAAKSVETMTVDKGLGYIETTGDLCDALAAAIRRGE